MKNVNLLLIAAGIALSSASVNAATLSGATVDFTFDDTGLGSLFDTYSVTGDTLNFWPTSLVAEMSDTGIDIAKAKTPLVSISAKSGYSLTMLSLSEQGDYFRIETSADTTFVSAAGQLYVNDQLSDFTDVQSSNSAVTPSGIATGAKFLMPWSVSETVGLSGAESVTARVNNILVAGVFSGFGAAFIETNLISLGIQTTPVVVPVPAAFWMFGSSLLGVLVIGRRKSEA